jgi:hypothetical protein
MEPRCESCGLSCPTEYLDPCGGPACTLTVCPLCSSDGCASCGHADEPEQQPLAA